MSQDTPKEQNKGGPILPPEVDDFLSQVIQGVLMRYDILKFFHQNPYAILTISDLSVWMSREEKPLTDALQQLAKLGYLDRSYASSAYILTRDRDKRQRLEDFFGYLDARPDVARQVRRQISPHMEAD